jgi:hypothetical protein
VASSQLLTHHVETGRITTEDFAREHPEKVEWVKEKKGGK